MDVPEEEKLMKQLSAYEITTYNSFYDRVRNFKERNTPMDELLELAGRLPEEKV